MSRPILHRASTMDSATASGSSSGDAYARRREGESPYLGSANGHPSSSLPVRGGGGGFEDDGGGGEGGQASGSTPRSGGSGGSPAQPGSGGGGTHLSGLMCNVHRTTGREPHALVGATTTILGDKLYVFGGKILSRTRAALTADLYELDLIRRHWTKLEPTGAAVPPRYFHSMCSVGDTKLVCYGGMSPATGANGQPLPPAVAQNGQEAQPEVVVMSDIHIYDAPSNTWTYVPTSDTPQGRYAHCATILPSAASFANASSAPLSALQHNPAGEHPNQGVLGVHIDGAGGAEMVVVGGQDSANHYIEQISVFNLRSLSWTRTQLLGKSCGAYRSVVAPVSAAVAARIGKGGAKPDAAPPGGADRDAAASMLIYSNYNFLDVKLELQLRGADGSLVEKPMSGAFTPPGLRFPNGAVIANTFVVSGTYLTSSKQEYALWALDLPSLTWSRIDAGGNVFSTGSWNRGVLWSRRSAFVVLGSRKRALVDDYNHRRLNFSDVCVVELEAFGLYENPRRAAPASSYVSASAALPPSRPGPWQPGGRTLSAAAEELGVLAMAATEVADMDILAVGGERVPVNSRVLARRWGAYIETLEREGTAVQEGVDVATLRGGESGRRISGSTITGSGGGGRPRTLYMPHTVLTIQALVTYLYSGSLPRGCSPQVLCSLLQVARPYRVEGLLEAVVEGLHGVLDSRNAAAVFNAAAMGAGGGRGVGEGVWEEERGVGSERGWDGGDGGSEGGSGSEGGGWDRGREEWRGGVSAVIGLQKRGLRGLMEGRRLRERGMSAGRQEVGLGIS
ncbi:hypothetical protein VE03_07381 [Pseudogymnoascus sp. 23342-1-I1]|nr:hypothetical protein VE03_07381 [Pseudogymnoascus sp. 23342-1-I1]